VLGHRSVLATLEQIAESGAVAVLTVLSGSTDGLTQGYS